MSRRLFGVCALLAITIALELSPSSSSSSARPQGVPAPAATVEAAVLAAGARPSRTTVRLRPRGRATVYSTVTPPYRGGRPQPATRYRFELRLRWVVVQVCEFGHPCRRS